MPEILTELPFEKLTAAQIIKTITNTETANVKKNCKPNLEVNEVVEV
jgi:hypothetical protein